MYKMKDCKKLFYRLRYIIAATGFFLFFAIGTFPLVRQPNAFGGLLLSIMAVLFWVLLGRMMAVSNSLVRKRYREIMFLLKSGAPLIYDKQEYILAILTIFYPLWVILVLLIALMPLRGMLFFLPFFVAYGTVVILYRDFWKDVLLPKWWYWFGTIGIPLIGVLLIAGWRLLFANL